MVQFNGIQHAQMPVHKLQATKKTKSFELDEVHSSFILKMQDGRFAIFSAVWTVHKYEVMTELELNESFNEIITKL